MTATGLQTVFGTAEELAYGTPETPDRWFEILSESLGRQQEVIQSSGLRAGKRNLRRGSRRALTQRWGEGDVNLEVAEVGFGRWFEHMLGGAPVITQPDDVGAPSVFLHTYEMGSLKDKSQTLQKGLRDEDGATVEKFTYHGCKITTWEFSVGVGEILQLTLGIDAEDEDRTTPLAVHSYAEAGLFHFAQGAVRLGGAPVSKVLSASASGDNALKTDSYYLGTGGLKGQPSPNDFPTVEGSLNHEFHDPAAMYDAYVGDDPLELVLEFTGPPIEGGLNAFLRITIPEIHLTGETPTVDGPDVVDVDAPFEGAFDGANQSVKIEYQTTDAAA